MDRCIIPSALSNMSSKKVPRNKPEKQEEDKQQETRAKDVKGKGDPEKKTGGGIPHGAGQGRSEGQREHGLPKLLPPPITPSTVKERTISQLTDVYHTQGTSEETTAIIKSNNYQLNHEIGRGGYGVVFKVTRLTDREYLACKVIDVSQNKRKRMLSLKYELTALETMKSHKHVVRLLHHFLIDQKIYLFMEYASRGNIDAYIKRKGDLKESRARKWFKQIIEAVHYMHTKSFSHRDLKLQNILLDEDKNCKVSDFGLSRISYRRSAGVIMSDAYCGTVAFMAPEILSKDKMTGKRLYNPFISDIWALGICLYVILTRRYPFDYREKETMIIKQINHRWEFPPKKALSEEAKDLIRNMLEPDVQTRITFPGIFSHPWLEPPGDRVDEGR